MTTIRTDGHVPAPAVPAEGCCTTVPRWATNPLPGTAEATALLPERTEALLRRRAGELGVPLTTVFLAAHAKVLAVLSADPVVRSGFRPRAGVAPLILEMAVPSGSWRDLVSATAWARTAALSATPPPPSSPRPEVVFEPTGREPPALRRDDGTVLSVAAGEDDGRTALRLRYRTDVMDADHAARISGYHLTALERIATDPDAPHERATLVSEEEIRHQLDTLAGRHRPLPDRRFHELFEERARRHPDTVAIVHGDRSWTYRELDVRANRLAHALLAQGLRAEDVVAVVTGRGLGWAAAVLAVFKAGGAYLPVDPECPPGRMTTVLSRAACTHVLTDPDSGTNLDRALARLPGTHRLLVPDVTDRPGDDSSPGVEVGADQLAYVFFTSGSTGEPKGAMCEHEGLLNHLFAKIDDLRIDEDSVVAQTASQCFDISLWQLLAALATGGRTLLVDRATVLDTGRFLATVSEGGVTVLQVVPSYLDVVLTALARCPRALSGLRCVSVTGETLKSELAERWFATGPGVPLVNAYGLTETSDDTNHEVMHEAPVTGRVPLGRPVNNVRVLVVDDQLVPVPLGAPGAIVFSGVCVGRGYVNDAERTRLAYTTDPYDPGRRLFRSGDTGRWLPDGKLEFLGRRDTQVKIRGFRIELGEIENTLPRIPGVRDGAVVVAGPENHARLIAFCTGPAAADEEYLRRGLGELLPAYMVPGSFRHLEDLPLTATGKTDRKALTALAEERVTAEDACRPPRTPTERRLVAAWATALGRPAGQIGRRDDFFDLGGTSLSAVRLLAGLGRTVSLRDLTARPTPAALAELMDARGEGATGLAQPPPAPGSPVRTTQT
ncbi:non-ribosomal peptide synthetase [Streptomyces sp. NBC_00102]|uniref:non-ribosomal peptide synthetase n=1 Tax=Streptomyces sp. NBC_00102 TaxID=2975652 RepID=UPI002258BBBD|nr:non-ribosomal peptide synthetase [Streptomyces sp. NBC_00102]MCX5402027.1 non-ribosomal peptide synthetase [Streptomyces sp. NBC_00102]